MYAGKPGFKTAGIQKPAGAHAPQSVRASGRDPQVPESTAAPGRKSKRQPRSFPALSKEARRKPAAYKTASPKRAEIGQLPNRVQKKAGREPNVSRPLPCPLLRSRRVFFEGNGIKIPCSSGKHARKAALSMLFQPPLRSKTAVIMRKQHKPPISIFPMPDAGNPNIGKSDVNFREGIFLHTGPSAIFEIKNNIGPPESLSGIRRAYNPPEIHRPAVEKQFCFSAMLSQRVRVFWRP